MFGETLHSTRGHVVLLPRARNLLSKIEKGARARNLLSFS